MAPTKLTDADKTAILGLYRQPEETTSTLAERYGVSNSTISRLLKASLPADEYKALIQQKRGTSERSGDDTSRQNPPSATSPQTANDPGADAPGANDSVADDSAANDPIVEEAAPETPPKREAIKAPILKKREVAPEADKPEAPPPDAAAAEVAAEPEAPSQDKPVRRRRSRTASPDTNGTQLALDTAQSSTSEPEPTTDDLEDADLDKNWTETTAALGDDYEDDDDDSDDDDDEGGEGDYEATGLGNSLEVIEVYPLTSNALPVPCYLVVERVSSDLVALPLKTFASLGQIPEAEGELRTLPVFDNHRIARRFSRRNQRVIKVPDGSLLQTTSSYLQAKGITRLLIDGQVFALDEQAEPIGAAT